MKKFNKKGFTIVELVIVIAVIGILAGVLIQTFSGITQRANETAAMQEATSGRNAILALTEGQMPENTMFYILDYNSTDSKSTAKYAFKYVDGAMDLQDSATATCVPYMNGEYTCYIASEEAKDDDESNKLPNNTVISGYAVVITQYAGYNATTHTYTNCKAEKDHYVITFGTSADAENRVVINVYWSGDLNNSLIVFLGNNA